MDLFLGFYPVLLIHVSIFVPVPITVLITVALEKEMATHSSVLAWRIPRMEESGGLPSMGSHRVGHD